MAETPGRIGRASHRPCCQQINPTEYAPGLRERPWDAAAGPENPRTSAFVRGGLVCYEAPFKGLGVLDENQTVAPLFNCDFLLNTSARAREWTGGALFLWQFVSRAGPVEWVYYFKLSGDTGWEMLLQGCQGSNL